MVSIANAAVLVTGATGNTGTSDTDPAPNQPGRNVPVSTKRHHLLQTEAGEVLPRSRYGRGGYLARCMLCSSHLLSL